MSEYSKKKVQRNDTIIKRQRERQLLIVFDFCQHSFLGASILRLVSFRLSPWMYYFVLSFCVSVPLTREGFIDCFVDFYGRIAGKSNVCAWNQLAFSGSNTSCRGLMLLVGLMLPLSLVVARRS